MLLLKTTKNKILGSWRCGVQLLFFVYRNFRGGLFENGV